MEQTPRASVVIRCYNEAEHIGKLLAELKRQSFTDYEVIVVDSGSDDGTLDIVGSEDVILEHIRKEDFSFGRSLNIGCRAARGEFLVFISAHCYPEHEDWLVNLLAGFDDEKVAVVYGKQRGIPDSHFSERQIFKRWFPEESIARQEGPFSNNANAAVRRSLWELNPYDESLTGLEDVAWAQQVMRDGWWVSYRADAGVIHVHNETPSQIRNRYRREAITFQKVFPGEHFSTWDFLRLSTRNVIADTRAARDHGRAWRDLLPILRFRVSQFAGTYQGFNMRRPPSSDLKQRFYYPEDPG
ncbi:MAG TPA: glycosyltransferase family 2 protein [Acidimicrobiia bacterium]|nr:glycosyltransferase family 2 protein [Acidimicrobiia bacterium]